MKYWKDLLSATQSVRQGLHLTWKQMKTVLKKGQPRDIRDVDYFQKAEGTATIAYPHVEIPIPDVGRYQLHNEIDDCIVCDKCAVVCPVDCITIEPIKSPEVIGKTSDGTSKRIYAAKFDIDMAKCCFCGLCTTVCPTECLTMTPDFDYSVTNIKENNFAFAVMSADEIDAKQKVWSEHQAAKENAKQTPAVAAEDNSANQPTQPTDKPKAIKPVFKPKIKPPGSSTPQA